MMWIMSMIWLEYTVDVKALGFSNLAFLIICHEVFFQNKLINI